MPGLTSPTHIVLLLLLALLLFGAKRLPEIGRSLGHGMREFKDSVSGNEPAPTEAVLALHAAQAEDSTAVTREHEAA